MCLVEAGWGPGSMTVQARSTSIKTHPFLDTSASLPSVFQTSSSDPVPSDRFR
jgi:hypothetical protein